MVGKTQTTLNLTMYNCKVVIMVVSNIKEEIQKIYKKHKIKDEFEDDVEGVLIIPGLGTYYLLISCNYLSHNTIAHEIFHAAVRVTEDRGITDEEAQAWLAGHITGEFYKFLDKKKLIVKHG